MRAFSLIAFAAIVLGGASALTVPAKQVATTNNVEQLEAREPKNPIKFSKGSKSHMDRLGLHKNSLDRQQVKEYHRQVVGQEMNHNGASSAQVVHLAHSVGSVDPKFHVTAGFWDANDKRIKSSYGNPPKKGNLHHVYADHVDPTYAHYVHQAGGHLRRSLSDLEEFESREPRRPTNGRPHRGRSLDDMEDLEEREPRNPNKFGPSPVKFSDPKNTPTNRRTRHH